MAFSLRDRLGVKVGLSKVCLFSFKDNPMLSSQSHQVELPTAVFSYIHYNLSGYSIKLIDAHSWLIWQRDDGSRKFLYGVFDSRNSFCSLYPLCSFFCRSIVHESSISLFQFVISHHRVNCRALDRRVAKYIHHIGA